MTSNESRSFTVATCAEEAVDKLAELHAQATAALNQALKRYVTSRAEPSRAEPSRPSRAEAEPCRAEPGRSRSRSRSRAGPGRAGPI